MPQDHIEIKKSSPPDFVDIELADVIDVSALKEMMDDYYALTGIGIGIIDLKGRVLVGTGWQDICVKFHRAEPESCAFCHESDLSLSSGVPPGSFKEYRCKNNMWDIATPIMLGDRHIGNIFLGQFLYECEEPDYELFRAQARRFGYDEAEYLAALDRVPRWSRETVQHAMTYYAKLARMISKANYNNVILADTLVKREQAEESLWLMNHVFYASITANSIAGLDGIITETNNAFLRTWEYGSRDEVIGRPIAYFFDDPNEAAAILTALNETGLWEGEFSAKRGDGSKFIAYGMATVVLNKNGNVIGYQSTCLDITGRKQAEAELIQAKAAAESANIAKSRFLATMSHEIRTPMNSVIGMIQLLQHTELTPEQHEYAECAKRSGIQLVHLLDDILDLSKIEAKKIELETSDFDLQQLISDAINLLSLSALEKGVKLITSLDSEVPTALKGDAGRLRQIIINLVGNAIKFTAEGSVTLNIRRDSEDEQSTTLRFLVSDSGIGIAADKLEQIFELFTQADSSTTRKFGGTGLGLAICKRLALLMGGSIGAESIEGKGSLFWFTVVLEKQVKPYIASLQSTSAQNCSAGMREVGSGTRLLLVEDDPTAQSMVLNLLLRYGFLVDVACNGREALQSLEKNDYALVLMDCMMPEISGYEATVIIRDPDSAVRRHDIPVIALTGNAMKEDQDRCIAVGMNDHLPKPLILKDLLHKLDYWLKTQA